MSNTIYNKEDLINELENYKENTGCRGVVIGVSGGKDSTTVLMAAIKVWGDNVFAVLMPNGDQKDINDSLTIVQTLGVNHGIVNIEAAYNNLIIGIEEQIGRTKNGKTDFVPNCCKVSEKAKTNIPPRLRMTTLYAIAQSMGYRVLGTGNASEIYVGWFTKWGDGANDFNPLANIVCTNVVEIGKQLAKDFNLDQKYLVKPPADGLTGKTDEDNLGFTYAQLDNYLINGTSGSFEVDKKISQMHEISAHKRK